MSFGTSVRKQTNKQKIFVEVGVRSNVISPEIGEQ